ncbi:DUF732 domain-containing protein [Mycobacterium colombiense]|uniref:DUF732 domain-containing protein n=1 Tax=Mycobacterium colombiense CECT 3035 TaxID=1041522 RepID=J4TDC9_9MYCO|nr:DUF732 domain-containing protein [Mycobacterium colombiense]EJO86748.1 hypothetical protein MCOL_V222603 [Mycobacterium colombiense CECT 3035]
MRARPIVLTVVAAAAAITLAAPARADDTDDNFWAIVQTFEMGPKVTKGVALSQAKTFCGDLRRGDSDETPAQQTADEGAWLANWANTTEYKAGEFLGVAINTYCPEQMSAVQGG